MAAEIIIIMSGIGIEMKYVCARHESKDLKQNPKCNSIQEKESSTSATVRCNFDKQHHSVKPKIKRARRTSVMSRCVALELALNLIVGIDSIQASQRQQMR